MLTKRTKILLDRCIDGQILLENDVFIGYDSLLRHFFYSYTLKGKRYPFEMFFKNGNAALMDTVTTVTKYRFNSETKEIYNEN